MIIRINQNQLNKQFDLIVIGGGINGTGIARDASERGLKVLLLEKEDFGSGCTCASSRLIHGGLRYLEHFEFDLVRESLQEREILLKNARHLINPIELCIPVYKNDRRNYWLIKTGMVLYDILSFDKSLQNHKMLNANDFISYEPAVSEEGLRGAAIFYDCQAEFPERICLENALMAKQNGAMVLNHIKVTNFKVESNNIKSVEFLDCLSGNKYSACGKVIVNASGPWVDTLCKLINPDIKRKIGGTKGSHIVVNKFESGPRHAVYASAKSDGRPFFIIPWQNYYLIGTTDIPYDGNLDKLKSTEEEINYLLNEANRILKTRRFTKSDILFAYSGVRPLPFMPGQSPSNITRKHIVCDHREDIWNLISVIGGKLTTYRNLSEHAVDLALKKLNIQNISSKTKTLPFLRNIDSNLEQYFKQHCKKVQKKYGLDDDIFKHLIKLYGSHYKVVLDLTLKEKELGYLLDSNSLDIKAQVIYAIQQEMAFTITDILLRRSTLGFNTRLGVDSIGQVADILKQQLNCTSDEIKKQIIDYEENVVKLRTVR